MQRDMLDAEFRLWCELRNRNVCGLKFRRQQPIGAFIVDFFCAEARLIIKVDGGQHAEASHALADAERKKWLEDQGYTLIRFWTNEVIHELDGVCAAIIAAARGEWRNE
jgi:very-short-patch-repair endonuclease